MLWRVSRHEENLDGFTILVGLGHTWKTPQGMPHIASPKAKTFKDGEKNGIKITTASQAMNAIIVGRQPNRSWVYKLIIKPASCPTRAEFDRPDCHDAVIILCP